MATNDRPTLGPFMSLVCFQYLRLGTEEVADRAPIVASGRKRGYDVVEGLGLMGSTQDAKVIRDKLDDVLGIKGTRLCNVKSVAPKANGGYEVRIDEGACTAGQTSSEPVCAFTMGVFIGAVHAITGTRMKGQETECCACGANECVYQIDPV
ncbi:MAG TPA: 4-vinyl reductase [Roseiflexaceae bacterium]|nr:4-vinyl reductase [Roseiflexaceae bacterium]